MNPKIVKTIGNGLLSLLLGGIALSFGTASLVAVKRILEMNVVGIGVAAAWVVILFIALRQALNNPAGKSDRAFLFGWAFFIIAIRLLIWQLASGYEQIGDCLFLLETVRLVAREWYTDDVMIALAKRYYDDYLWIGRAIPFFLPLARLWPGHEETTARILNIMLSISQNLLVYDLAKKLAGRRAGRIAYALITLIPIHSWLLLDYTHQYLGAWLVTIGVYLLIHTMGGWATTYRLAIRNGFFYGIVLSLLCAQSGIDNFMLVVAAFALIVQLSFVGPSDERSKRLIVMLSAAAFVYGPLRVSYNTWLNKYRPYRMSSHPISYTARGWNVVTWGEYYGVYEQIDRETQWPEKPETMKSLILSQMAYEPYKTLIALPIVKIAKYFLVGYATAIEQQLAAAGHGDLRQVFRGKRVTFAPVFLMICILGLGRLIRFEEELNPLWIFTAGVPLIFCAIYCVAGETSPRYSFHVHGMMAVLGASTWAELSCTMSVRKMLRILSCWWGGAIFMLFALALALPPVIIRHAGDKLFVNLRALAGSPYSDRDGEPTVFTERIHCDSTRGAAESTPIVPPAWAKRAVFFIWPLDRNAMRGGRLVARHGEEIVWKCDADGIPHVMRIVVTIASSQKSVIRLACENVKCSSDSQLLRWGYICFDTGN